MQNEALKTGEMNYFDHLEVLRRKIISIIAVLVVVTVAAFFVVDHIIVLLKMPVARLHIEFYYFKPQEKVLTYLKVAFFTALVVTLPFIVFQAADFILPALKPHEKRYCTVLAVLSVMLFFTGALFSYFFLTPLVFQFFINFSKNDMVQPLWSIGEYFDLFLTMVIMIGAVFEFPLILLVLVGTGILDLKTVASYRPHAIVIIFVIAAIVTPTVDIFTQSIVGGILYLLFEITLIVGKLFQKNKTA